MEGSVLFAANGGKQFANASAPDKLAALDDWEAILFVMLEMRIRAI
jgi:hypothetical protein